MILRGKNKEYPVDKITKLYTRDFLFDFVDTKIQKHQKFGLILTDIDFFKTINDTYGHIKGDRIIHQVAKFLKDYIGDKGTVVRYGGDEFVIITNSKNIGEVKDIINGINESIKKHEFSKNPSLSIHLSLGGAFYPRDGGTLISLIKQADKELYQKKRKRFIKGRRVFGRERILVSLRHYLDNTLAGKGDILILYGEAGVGKTTIINEGMKYASLTGFNIKYYAFKDDEKYSMLMPLMDEIVYKKGIPEIEIFKNAILQLLKTYPLLIVFDNIKNEFFLPYYQSLKEFVKNRHLLVVFIIGKNKISIKGGIKIDRFTEEELKNVISAKFLGQNVQDKLVQDIYRLSGGNPRSFLRIIQNGIERGNLFVKDGIVESSVPVSNPEEILNQKVRDIVSKGGDVLNCFECAALLYPISDPDKISAICGIEEGIIKEVIKDAFENGEISSQDKFLFTDGALRMKLSMEAFRHKDNVQDIVGKCEKNGYYEVAARIYKSLRAYKFSFENYLLAAKEYMNRGIIDRAFNCIKECKRMLNKVIPDKRYYEYYGDIYYKKGAYSKAIEYYTEAVDKFDASELKRKIAHCYVVKGDTERAYELLISDRTQFLIEIAELFILIGLPKKALKFAREAVEHYDNPNMVMRAYASLGASYYSQRNYSKAYFYFSKGMSIARQVKDDYYEGIFDNRIGILKMDTGESDVALKYLLEAEKIFRGTGDEGVIGSILLNIGIIYNEKNVFDEAGKCFISAKEYALHSENMIILGKVLDSLGDLYLKIGKIKEGIKITEEALKIARKMRLKSTKISSSITLSKLYMLSDRLEDAEETLKKSLRTAKKYNLKDLEQEISANLIRCTMWKSPLSTKRIIDKLLRDDYNNRGNLFRTIAIYWNEMQDKEKASNFIKKAIKHHKYEGKLLEVAEDYYVYAVITDDEKTDEYLHLSKDILRRYNVEKGFEETFYRYYHTGH